MIHFTKEEAWRVMHLYNDAIIVEAHVVNNMVNRVFVDNKSLADILF